MARRQTSIPASAAALAILGLTLAGPLHMLAAQHTQCPVTGALIHVEEGSGAHHDANCDDHGPEDSSPVPHEHREDRCDLAALFEAPGTSSSPVSSAPVPVVDPVDAVPTVSERPHRSISLVSLAPSHSPPTV